MPGEWLFVDISHVKNQSFGGLQYWLLAVDDAMDFSFSLFLKNGKINDFAHLGAMRPRKHCYEDS